MGNIFKSHKSKMAATGYVGNYLFYGLAYNASKYMVSVTFWVGGFIIDVVLII